MKIEHLEAIERAKIHGVMPSVLAHELLVRDLVEAAMFEWQNIAAPFNKLNEGQRQEVTDRITEKVAKAVFGAVSIISSRSVDTIPLTVADAKFKPKTITLTAVIDAQDPNRHGLIDAAGKLRLLVLAPNDYAEGLESLQAERDQKDLPLHVSELTGSLFAGRASTDEDCEPHPVLGTADELAERTGGGSQDPLYNDAIEQVIAYGRLGAAAIAGTFKISNERAIKMLEAMVAAGIAVSNDGGKVFELVGPISDDDSTGLDGQSESQQAYGKEFGDYTYEDAAQLIVLKATVFDAAWLQSRLAIDSDQANTLLLRLVDNEVIQLETEADLSIDNIYKVIASLADLGPNLSVE